MVYLVQDRDVVTPCIKEDPSLWMRSHRQQNKFSVSLKVANKMSKLVARVYITEGLILVLTSFFYVTKGTYGTPMVFDETVSGLNDSL